jgi:poly(3-hydroxybutyrate) depolymerase
MARTDHKIRVEDTWLDYAVITPDDFDPQRGYPCLLAFPPAQQSLEQVRWCLDNYWQQEAEKRGWLVICPASPDKTQTFFTGAERYIPALVEQVKQQFHIEGDRLHLGGISNGGKSAFKLACLYPDQFGSLLVLPGHPPLMPDFADLPRLKGKHVAMFVGEHDENWIEMMEATERILREQGIDVSLTFVKGDGHEIHSLKNPHAGHLFDLLESWRL